MPLPRPAPGTARWWVIGSILTLFGVAAVVWYGLAYTAGQVTYTTVSYRVADAGSVTVDFDVTMDPGTSATCTVRALAENFSVVGTLDVPIPASTETTTSHTTTVRTTSLAVTGLVDSCRANP